MSKDDDDLRFGDVDHEKDNQQNDSASGISIDTSGIDILPPVVGGVIAIYILISQPLSGTVGGFSLNMVAVLLIAAGGILGGFDD